jgi:hypothetical protein
MDIVRRRLAAAFGGEAALAAEARDGRYRAAITLPGLIVQPEPQAQPAQGSEP